MSAIDSLFQAALGLTNPWFVKASRLTDSPTFGKSSAPGGMVLELEIDFNPGARLPCPDCGCACPSHDTSELTWRHLNFWQHASFLRARVPRVKCPDHGVKQVTVPWARAGSGFTLLFEAMTLALAKHMPMSSIAAHVGEHDTRLWRILRHYVAKAYDAATWSEMTTLGVDETSARKGHRYVTVVVDVDSPQVQRHGPRLIYMTPGRKAESLAEFVQEMPRHAATPEQIKLAALDMGRAFISGVSEYLPNAKICLDRYHVMQLVGKAIDEERRYLQSLGCDLKGALWALRGNEENLKEKHRELRRTLCKEHTELARCMALRDHLQAMWSYEEETGPVLPGAVRRTARQRAAEHLQKWCGWAQRSRLASFVRLARTLREHTQAILNYYPSHLTSAAVEAINGLIQTAKRRAKGYRNFENLRAIAYWVAGKLDINVVTPMPTTP